MINRLRSWTRAFFGISTREANGLLILLPVLMSSVFVMPAYHHWQSKQPVDFSKNRQSLDSLLAHWPEPDSTASPSEKTLFAFDPNTASLPDFDSLGVPGFLAQRILNYRSRNGTFRIKSDLLKIYGMDTLFYNELIPFIQLPEQAVADKPSAKAKEEAYKVTNAEVKHERTDINTADSTQLKKVYGIGEKLSARIISYRSKLGGFVSMQQLQEVYGLDSAVIHRLERNYYVDPAFQPRKIILNQASEKELSSHPYIKYPLAKAIATYRFQHGNFNALEEVKEIAVADEAFYTKILPYLSLNP
ncbi:MAG: helix-hairpin-helix domain-containing protein [Cyclobacteriaceae bacterium]|nr:helix-hairpin-helix domain-containing protein [Cyclobacteriaceae bacterium]